MLTSDGRVLALKKLARFSKSLVNPLCLRANHLFSRDLVLSEFQIARAKVEGASGVTVGIALAGHERSAELITACKKLGEGR